MHDLLDGVRVLDVSLLAPSMLGMRLAELGYDSIRVAVLREQRVVS